MVLTITNDGIAGGGSLRGGDGSVRLPTSSQKVSLMFHDYYHNDDDEGEEVG
jgi:hypothetical protein